MAQKNSQNSLDNLMMAYADLSGGAKGSSFKGPALKDVKVQKSQGPSFKPSQKARDWSSLEQSLESAFSSNQQQSLPSTQDEWGDFTEISQSTSTNDDEFSDFVTPNTPQIQNQTIGSRLASIQDESPVHNFKPKPASSIPQFQQKSPQMFADFQGLSLNPQNLVSSSSISSPPEQNIEDDDFGDFTGPSVMMSPPTQNKDLTSTIPSFTPQVPVQAAKIPDSFADFSNFASEPSVPSGPIQSNPAPITFPSPPKISSNSISLKPISDLNIQSIPTTLQPKNVQAQQDRYSALRDIFGPTEPSEEPSNIQTKSLPPILPPSTKKIQENLEDDDFGDFVTNETPAFGAAPTSLIFPMTSNGPSLLPDESLHGPQRKTESKIEPTKVQDVSNPNYDIFKHNSEPNAFIPWHDSSPPPPPEDICVEEEIDLEMNTLGYQFTENDQNTTTTPNSSVKLPSLNLKSMSPEVTNINTIEEKESKIEQTKDFITENLPIEPKSDVKGGNEEQEKNFVKLLQAIFNILNHAFEIFDDINDDDLKVEVLTSPEADKYLNSLLQVYRVFQRLQVSLQVTPDLASKPDISQLRQKINSVWDQFTQILSKSQPDLLPNQSLLDFNHCKPYASKTCPICHLDLDYWSKETSSNLTDSIIDFKYHSICANLWVNSVDPALPN